MPWPPMPAVQNPPQGMEAQTAHSHYRQQGDASPRYVPEKNTITDTKVPYQACECLPMLPITPSQNKLVSVPEWFAEVCKSPNQPWEIFMWTEIPHIEDVRRHNSIPGSHKFS